MCIELVRHQYSGNALGVIVGIGLVTCVYVNPETDHFWLLERKDNQRNQSSAAATCQKAKKDTTVFS